MAASALLTVMINAARKAARGVKRDFGEVESLQVSLKGPADYVTRSDQRTEAILVEELKKARPGYGFLLEESGEIKGADGQHRWLVDPIDGTTNFIHGIPHFAVSIGLEREGVLAAGLIYNPITDDTFTAEKGRGAFLNNRRLRVSARRSIGDAVIACGIPHRGRGDHARFQREIAGLQSKVSGLRRFGAASLDLAWVAAGRFDAFWERGLAPWDIAAGILLVREAGGLVDEIDGGDVFASGDILAANGELFEPIRKELGAARLG